MSDKEDMKGIRAGDKIVWSWPVANKRIVRGQVYLAVAADEGTVTLLLDGERHTWGQRVWRLAEPRFAMEGGAEEYELAIAAQDLLNDQT